jgi:hypothetical protein
MQSIIYFSLHCRRVTFKTARISDRSRIKGDPVSGSGMNKIVVTFETSHPLPAGTSVTILGLTGTQTKSQARFVIYFPMYAYIVQLGLTRTQANRPFWFAYMYLFASLHTCLFGLCRTQTNLRHLFVCVYVSSQVRAHQCLYTVPSVRSGR